MLPVRGHKVKQAPSKTLKRNSPSATPYSMQPNEPRNCPNSRQGDRGPEQERRAMRGLLQLRLRRLDRPESDTPEPDLLGPAEPAARGAAQESPDTARGAGPRRRAQVRRDGAGFLQDLHGHR